VSDVQEPPPLPKRAADRLRVHACQRTLRWVAENAESWTADQELDNADLLILSMFARSTRTYEAIVRWLGERAFGEQGLMLNRSLYEDMVDIHWVHLNPDLALKRLGEHDLHSRLLRADTQRKFSHWFDGRKPPPIKVSNEKRKELIGLYGRGGSRSWTGVPGLEDRLESVIGCWKTEADRDQVRFWAAWVVRLLNETLHPSGWSLGRLAAPTVTDAESFLWRFGSTPEWLTQSLHCAFWTYHQIVGLVIERYAPETAGPAAGADFVQGHRDFAQASHWEKTGRMESLNLSDPATGE
jgi:hypothetical protein